MIVKLKGHIDNIDEENIDLDVQGVVYRILMSKKKYHPTWSDWIIYRNFHL